MVRSAICLLLLGIALAACGKKGELMPPEKVTAQTGQTVAAG